MLNKHTLNITTNNERLGIKPINQHIITKSSLVKSVQK